MICPILVFSQKPKVLVVPSEYEGWAQASTKRYGDSWEIVNSLEKSNVIFNFNISKSLLQATGHLEIINSKSELIIYKTPTMKGYNIVTSAYSPMNDLIKKLIYNTEKNFDKSIINLGDFGEKTKTAENTDKYDNLIKLKSLLDQGIITIEEFEIEKTKILNKQ
jgi:hypothetical protein